MGRLGRPVQTERTPWTAPATANEQPKSQSKTRRRKRVQDRRAVLRYASREAMPGLYLVNALVIVRARQARGWNQQALGRFLGVSQPTISQIERGLRVMNEHQARQLATALFTGDPLGDRWRELVGPELVALQDEATREQIWRLATYGSGMGYANGFAQAG